MGLEHAAGLCGGHGLLWHAPGPQEQAAGYAQLLKPMSAAHNLHADRHRAGPHMPAEPQPSQAHMARAIAEENTRRLLRTSNEALLCACALHEPRQHQGKLPNASAAGVHGALEPAQGSTMACGSCMLCLRASTACRTPCWQALPLAPQLAPSVRYLPVPVLCWSLTLLLTAGAAVPGAARARTSLLGLALGGLVRSSLTSASVLATCADTLLVQVGYPAGLIEEQLLFLLPESDPRRQRETQVPAEHALATGTPKAPSSVSRTPQKHYPSSSGDALGSVVRQLEAGLQHQRPGR